MTLGKFEVNQATQSLSFAGEEISLTQKKFFEVLSCLVDKYPNFVTREELIEQVWQGNYFIGDKAVNNAIWVLRKTLKDYDPEQQYIVTKRGVGYRLAIEPVVASLKAKRQNFIYLAAVFGVSVIAISSWLYIDTEKPVKLSLITDSSGNESQPAVSPSGKELAFTWRKPGQSSNLYIKDLTDNQKIRQITFNDNKVYSPAWINHGIGLAYVEKDKTNKQCNIKKVILSTLDTEVIATCNYNSNTYVKANFAGDIVLFNKFDQDNYRSGLYKVNVNEQPYKEVRISCGDECSFEDREVAFTPEPDKIVVSRRFDRLSENLFLVNLITREESQLTFEETDIKGIAVSTDEQVYFGAKEGGQNIAKQVSLAGGSVKNLNVIGFVSPSFNPRDSSLYFSHSRAVKDIHYINLNHAQKFSTSLLTSAFAHRNAEFSASANKLVFISGQSGHMEVWSSNSDGSNKQQLTYLKSVAITPSWSNDGKKIAFLTPKKNSGGNEIKVIDIVTRKITTINSPFNNHNRPTWSNDDRTLLSAISDDRGSLLYRFTFDTTAPMQLSDKQIRFIRHYKGNKWLFSKGIQGGLWIASENEDGTFTQLNKLLANDEFNSRYNWTIHQETIFYTRKHSDRVEIKSYNLVKQIDKLLISLPSEKLETYGSFTFDSMNQWLIYTQRKGNPYDIAKITLPKHD
ncbi:winged helix-turn-helix domain-containing protein [Colwellia psychrerythraea]|uniref:winged helix-turn-helix domain-containing protein n=1 Tax=Colwellia psychrerythraea TaxID=28229 RepID=UPI001CC0DECC|nr:winged helix-turn-helix domain-containing protein [Colwellia psychrerythraea]